MWRQDVARISWAKTPKSIRTSFCRTKRAWSSKLRPFRLHVIHCLTQRDRFPDLFPHPALSSPSVLLLGWRVGPASGKYLCWIIWRQHKIYRYFHNLFHGLCSVPPAFICWKGKKDFKENGLEWAKGNDMGILLKKLAPETWNLSPGWTERQKTFWVCW